MEDTQSLASAADFQNVECVAAQNLRALVEHGLALALPVAVCDVLPWNNGWPDKEAAIRHLNGHIHEFGVPVLPFQLAR